MFQYLDTPDCFSIGCWIIRAWVILGACRIVFQQVLWDNAAFSNDEQEKIDAFELNKEMDRKSQSDYWGVHSIPECGFYLPKVAGRGGSGPSPSWKARYLKAFLLSFSFDRHDGPSL